MAMNADDLVDLIERVVLARLTRLFGMLPGRVQSYDAAAQTCVVQPEPQTRDENGEAVDQPVIADVPVVWLRAGGGSLTFPLKAGDQVMLVSASADLDAWHDAGGNVDPGEDRRGSLSDVVAVPGLYPRSQKLAAGLASAVDAILQPPAGGKLLVGKDAAKGAARVDDATATTVPADWSTFATAVAGVCNGIAPGSVVVPAPGDWSGKITAGSAKTLIE